MSSASNAAGSSTAHCLLTCWTKFGGLSTTQVLISSRRRRMSTEYFLDTAAAADGIFGARSTRHAIATLLCESGARSSSYVREQFRATFLRAAILLYNSLFETRDAAEALRRTDQWAFFQKGEGVKARKIFSTLMEDGRVDVEDRLATLERLIEFDMMRLFDELARTLGDETRCCLCAKEPVRDGQGVFRFKQDCTVARPTACHIEIFWERKREELEAVATSQDPELPEMVRETATSVRNGGAARGKACYVHLSDATIAAEAPPNTVLLTSNMKDFVPIARAIGKGRTARNY
jgi:hypothetical protein